MQNASQGPNSTENTDNVDETEIVQAAYFLSFANGMREMQKGMAERGGFSPIVRESHQLRRKFKTAASQIQGSAQNQPSRHSADEVIRQSRPSHLETTETAPYPWVAVWLALRTRPTGFRRTGVLTGAPESHWASRPFLGLVGFWVGERLCGPRRDRWLAPHDIHGRPL